MIHDVTAPIRSYLTAAPAEVRITSFSLKSTARARRNQDFSKDNTCPFFAGFSRGKILQQFLLLVFLTGWPQRTPPALADRKANTCSLLAQPPKALSLPHIPAWWQHSKSYFEFLSQSRLLCRQGATLSCPGAAQLGKCPLPKCPRVGEGSEAPFLQRSAWPDRCCLWLPR